MIWFYCQVLGADTPAATPGLSTISLHAFSNESNIRSIILRTCGVVGTQVKVSEPMLCARVEDLWICECARTQNQFRLPITFLCNTFSRLHSQKDTYNYYDYLAPFVTCGAMLKILFHPILYVYNVESKMYIIIPRLTH